MFMSITIKAAIEKSINYAAVHEKKQTIVGDIQLEHIKTDRFICRIYSVPEFLFEYKQEISVNSDKAKILSPALNINDVFYRKEFIEAKEGEIRIELYHPDAPDTILGFLNTPVHIQPYLHWDGGRFPETLPGFMQPNDNFLLQVIKKAGEYASESGEIMCGYQHMDEEGVKRQAGYIYHALQDMYLHYISSPASFETQGQKIRITHQILDDESRQGTCLDLAALFATCLEAVSLNSLIVHIPGHAFAGVWLNKQSYARTLIHPSDMNEDEWNEMKKHILFVECTTLTDNRDIGFNTAVSIATRNSADITYAVDVKAARNEGIVPVYTYTDHPICSDSSREDEGFERQEFSKEKKTKLDLLRDQAMDISTKSRLLNTETQPLALNFNMDAESFMKNEISDVDITKMLEEKTGKKKNTDILRELYSKSRQNIRESGKSNLFISINALRWRQDTTEKYYNAVLYLCPAEIYRNGRGDFQIRLNPEETFFNPALKVLLDQVYHLDSRKLLDYPGEKYDEQMRRLKFLIEHQKGWSIKQNTACLSLYMIPNEAVWNGLNDETVISHEIVSGILDGKMSWDNQIPVNSKSDSLSDIYAFETDSSQNEIIKAAFQKKAQVVVGPAGNGKTQTIVNIMLEAVRRGEKVLFVSEMAPAMEVAYSKLNEIFDGLFNLRIIQGKDKLPDVVQQIKKTLDYMEMGKFFQESDDVLEAKKKYRDCMDYLEKYYRVMSVKNECGKSLEELIDMYEKYADCLLNLKLDDIISGISFFEAEEQIGILSKAMEECDRVRGDYSEYVRYDNLDGEREKQTLELAENALRCYKDVWDCACSLREMLGIQDKLSEKAQLQQMVMIAKTLKRCPVLYKGIDEVYEKQDIYDTSYTQELISELKKLNAHIPAFMKKNQKNKCFEMLRKIYSLQETRDILEDFELHPEEVMKHLSQLKIVLDEDGMPLIECNDHEIEVFSEYMADTDEMLKNESDNTEACVREAIDTILRGNGQKIQSLSKKVDMYYKNYSQAQKPAAEKIIRNVSDFTKNYPDTPRKVLFEEWIQNRNIDTNRSRSLYDGIVTAMNKQGYSNIICQIENAKKVLPLTSKDIMDGFYKSWASYQIDEIQKNFLSDNDFNYFIFQDKVQQLAEKEKIIRENLKYEICQAQINRMPNIQEGVSNNPEFGVLQTFVRRKNIAIRTFFEETPHIMQLLCPCMIMDPSAAASYIPSDFPKFDLVLIDEGSQMPAYNALIPIARAERCMIFGDEKQLQPMDEFKKRIGEDFDTMLAGESILTAAYITSMPRKMLRFHYRSENESLIAFSNIHYYNGDIISFPACDTHISGLSYEFVENGVYDRAGSKANLPEAERVIQRIREIYDELPEDTHHTLGIITLNIHQRDMIQKLLLQEVKADSSLGMKVDELVSVVNLESCQGKEWDYVIISPGFANDETGKFSTGFGALNREYGANRLNVMITRARKKMMVITSIEPFMLTNTKSEGVRAFKEFLQFAKGDIVFDSRILDNNGRTRGLIDRIASSLEKEGYEVHTNIGSSEFKVDLAIVSKSNPNKYDLGILVDHYRDTRSSIHDREVTYPKILESKGWKVYRLRELNWNHDPHREVRQIIKAAGGVK